MKKDLSNAVFTFVQMDSNPGFAKILGYSSKKEKIVIEEIVGYCTNNMAEYLALCAGVRYAIANNCETVLSSNKISSKWFLNKAPKINLVLDENPIGGIIEMERRVKENKSYDVTGENNRKFIINNKVNFLFWNKEWENYSKVKMRPHVNRLVGTEKEYEALAKIQVRVEEDFKNWLTEARLDK